MNARNTATWQATRFVGAGFAAAAVLIALVLTNRIFTPAYQVGPILVAAAGTGAIAILVSPLHAGVRALAVVVAASTGAGVVIRSIDGRLPGDLLRASFNGISDLLATVWPSPPLASGVGAIAFFGALGVGFAVDLAAHGRPGSALVVATAMLALVAMLGAPAGAPPPWAIAVFIGAALGVLAAPNLTYRSGITMIVAATVASTPFVLANVVEADRFDPREVLTPPISSTSGVSPLARLEEWRSLSPAEVFFTSTLETPTRWRLVGLNRYDGRAWFPADDYRRAGSVIQPRDQNLDSTTIDVSIGQLDAPWLPMIDRTITVSETVRVDSGRSGLLIDDDASSPVASRSYRLDLQPYVVSPSQLTYAKAAAASSPFVGGFAPSLQILELASSITAGARSDFERAELLAAYLRSEFSLDPDGPPGHSIAILNLFIDFSRRGSDEQFVAAYGILAAAVGLPVRIAVGFETRLDDQGVGTVALSEQAVAWPEVEFETFGWVPFDPVPESTISISPSRGEGAIAPTDEETSNEPPTTEAPNTESTSLDREEADTTVVRATESALTPAVAGVLGLGGIVFALVLYVVVVTMLKARRRRQRREAADPRDRAIGAFISGIESMIDLKLADPSNGSTNHQLVMRDLTEVPGSPSAMSGVAALATEAMYRPAVVSEQRSDAAWQTTLQFERDSGRRVGRFRKLRARTSLRSLRRRW